MLRGIFIPHEIKSIAYFYALPEGTNVHYSMTLVKTYWRLFNQLIMELMSIIRCHNWYIWRTWRTIAFIHLQMLTCRFFWKGGNSSVELSPMKVPNFKIVGHKLSETNVQTKTGKIVVIRYSVYCIIFQLFEIFHHLTVYIILGRYNRLKCHFFLKRMIDKFVHK